MKLLRDLFFTMLKIGVFTFGVGYAMIALLENAFVTQKKWIDHEEFLDMVAISESTPGPIAINAATYIGYKVAGFWGSLCATVGVCIPSFGIIYVISLFFNQFLSLHLVAAAFKGIQVCVIYLIFTAGWKLLRQLKKNTFTICILVAVVVIMVTLSVLAVSFSTIVLILLSGLMGCVVLLPKKEGKV